MSAQALPVGIEKSKGLQATIQEGAPKEKVRVPKGLAAIRDSITSSSGSTGQASLGDLTDDSLSSASTSEDERDPPIPPGAFLVAPPIPQSELVTKKPRLDKLPLPEITLAQQGVFYEIFQTLATTSVFALAWQKSRLEELAEQVRGVHSLSFVAHVYRTPHLKQHLITLRDTAGICVAWQQTLGDFETKMGEYKKHEHFHLYLGSFLEEVSSYHHDTIRNHISNNQFRELLTYILGI
jgi:hypothetical protein